MEINKPKKKIKGILFLCVANSARSQVAEGLARRIFGPSFQIQSAGTRPSAVNPFAVRVMAEIGIDISDHLSKSVNEIDASSVDLIITLCQEEVCPTFLSNIPHLHWPMADPASTSSSDQETALRFRDVRDAIGRKMQNLKSFFDVVQV